MRKIEYYHQGSIAGFKIMYRDSESIPDGHWFLGSVIIACLLLTPCPGNAQSASAIKPAVTAMPLNFQLSTGPSMHTIESSNLDDDFSPGEATTNAPAELDEIYAPHKSYLGFTGIDRLLNLLANPLGALHEATGLRLGAANTMLFMQPIGGQSSEYGAAYDLDVISSWTLIGRGSEDTGRLVITGEYREKIGDQPPSVLGRQMGTLVAPTNAFNDRGLVVRDFYWVQRLFDARVRILIGRGDPSDYVGAVWLQNVNNSFVNRSFSANPAVPFPGHGPSGGARKGAGRKKGERTSDQTQFRSRCGSSPRRRGSSWRRPSKV